MYVDRRELSLFQGRIVSQTSLVGLHLIVSLPLVPRKLSDIDQDGALTLHEFCIAMKLVLSRRKGNEIPATLPEYLLPKKQSELDTVMNKQWLSSIITSEASRPQSATRLKFVIPPPPPATAASGSSCPLPPPVAAGGGSACPLPTTEPPPVIHSQSSGQFVAGELTDTTDQWPLVAQHSAPDMFTDQKRLSGEIDKPPAAVAASPSSTHEQHKKSKKNEEEEDERALISESHSSDLLASDGDNDLRLRSESLGFGFDAPLTEKFADQQMLETAEPAVARLISIEVVEEMKDTFALVGKRTERRRSSSLSEQPPKPKPRKKRPSPNSERSSSSTDDTPTRKPAPPPPLNHGRAQRSSSPLTRSSSTDSFQSPFSPSKGEVVPLFSGADTSTPTRQPAPKRRSVKPVRPPRVGESSSHQKQEGDGVLSDSDDLDRQKLVHVSPRHATSVEATDDPFDMGHTRNPSWDLSRMLKDEQTSCE